LGYFLFSRGSPVRDALEGWTPATKSARNDDLRMSILLVVEEPRLELIEICSLSENVSDNHIITFADASSRAKQAEAIEVRDDLGNKYARPNPFGIGSVRYWFPGWNRWAGLGGDALRPKKIAYFDFLCPAPLEKAKMLYVELPSHVIGSVEKFRFRIPIKRETVTYLKDWGWFPRPDRVPHQVLFKRDDFQEWFSMSNKKEEDIRKEQIRDRPLDEQAILP
jgi:hypothetical protein